MNDFFENNIPKKICLAAGFLWGILLLGVAGFFSSCTEDEPPKLSISSRKIVDTLVAHQLDSLAPILDSICDDITEQTFQYALDSALAIRKKQEERLRQLPSTQLEE